MLRERRLPRARRRQAARRRSQDDGLSYALYRVRRSTTPLQLDVVEAFAQGRLSRREFMKRGDDRRPVGSIGHRSSPSSRRAAPAAPSAPPAAAGAGAAASARRRLARRGRRHHPGRRPAPGRAARPGPHAGPRRLRPRRPVFEFLAALDPTRQDIGPWLAPKWAPNATTPSGPSSSARREVADGRDFTADDVVATMDRLVDAGNAGLKGVIDEGSTRSRPTRPP